MTRVGTVLSLADPVLAEAAAARLDVVWIDLEHGALDRADAQLLVLAAQGQGCAAAVRIPGPDAEALPALLDAGADGVVLPCAERPADVARLVARLRHPPAGRRGYGPRRSAVARRAPAAPECVVQIESPAGVEAARAIAAVDGVDALVVGCSDLAWALGCPHALDAPALRAAVADVAAAAAGAGVRLGLAGGGTAAELVALAPGADLVVHSVDVRLYAAAVDRLSADLAAALEGAGAAA